MKLRNIILGLSFLGVSAAAQAQELNIYSGFSPNGDGTNETWVIENLESQPEHHLLVFNRNGQTVWETSRYANNWDGTDQNSQQPLPAGTYYYLLKVGQDTRTGVVTILR